MKNRNAKTCRAAGILWIRLGGKVSTDFGSGGDSIAALRIQPDGRIVVAGQTQREDGFLDLALARYNADGSLDDTFGDGGKIISESAVGEETLLDIEMQADKKIVVAGFSGDRRGDQQFSVARYIGAPSPDFAIGFDGPELTARRGSKLKINVRIERANGFNGNVRLELPTILASGLKIPGGSVTTTAAQVVFKLKVKASAPSGTQFLNFIGVDDSGRTTSSVLKVVIQ